MSCWLYGVILARVGRGVRVHYGGGGGSRGIRVKDALFSIFSSFSLGVARKPISTEMGGGIRNVRCHICGSGSMRFLSVGSTSNSHTCAQALFFMLYGTIRSVCPGASIIVSVPMSGKFCISVHLKHPMMSRSIGVLHHHVRRVVSSGVPVHHFAIPARRTVTLFRRGNSIRGIGLLEASNSVCAACCGVNRCISCCCNALLAGASRLCLFKLRGCCSNVLLHVPSIDGPSRLNRVAQRSGVFSVFGRRRH